MRKRSRPTTLPIGTISEGTLRPEDLIPEWLYALRGIRLSRADRVQVRQLAAVWNRIDPDLEDGAEDLGEVCDALQTIAEGYAPDYAYVGTLEGDGACFGVWPDLDTIERESRDRRYLDPSRPSSASVINVGDHDLPPAYRCRFDHAVTVNDHGNMTLYRRAGRRWIECWGVV